MYNLTPTLSFAATNEELQKRLRAKKYGKLEEHLDALDAFKMRMPEVLLEDEQVHLGLLMTQLLDATNNPEKMQGRGELIRNPDFPNATVPKSSYYTLETF